MGEANKETWSLTCQSLRPPGTWTMGPSLVNSYSFCKTHQKEPLFWEALPVPFQVVTHSSVSFLIPNHSLIFFCRAPFWVSHLEGRRKVGCAAEAGQAHRANLAPLEKTADLRGKFGCDTAACHKESALT